MGMGTRADRREVRSLTGLRGIAALLVVLLHTAPAGGAAGFGAVFIRHGYLWVDMFLLLSGFILLRTYERLFQERPFPIAYADFLLRRLARLWPLFALATVATFVARQTGRTWYADTIHPWRWVLVANLTMTQAWVGQDSIDVPGWSVSGEWACCLMFPLFLRLLDNRRGGSAAGLYLAAFAVLTVLAWLPVPARAGGLDLALPATPFPVLRCMASFAMGMALWRGCGHRRLEPLVSSPLADVVATGLILAMMGKPHTDLAIVALFSLLILCLSRQRGVVDRMLRTGPAYWAGQVSYSVYLLQVPLIVLKGQTRLTHDAQQVLVGYGLSATRGSWLCLFYVLLLICSAITWWMVERPSRTMLRAVAYRLSGLAA